MTSFALYAEVGTNELYLASSSAVTLWAIASGAMLFRGNADNSVN